MKDFQVLARQLKIYAKRKWKKYLIPFIILHVLKIGIILAIAFFSTNCYSQNKYWVFLKDKAGVQFNPYQYFDKTAIDRRVELGLNLYDSTDFPLNTDYIQQITDIGVTKYSESRWLNAVSIQASENQICEIKKLPFVVNVQNSMVASKPTKFGEEKKMRQKDIKLLKNQISSLKGEEFIAKKIDGRGVRIAIFDGGFPGVDKLPYFEHIRNENRIIKTYDFVKKREFVYDYNTHGTMTFSCIAGLADSLNIGLATGSEFLLARTETWTEFFSEEENWLAAVEWADKNGARIISSSLGYTLQRYHQRDMNGHTSLVAKAALLAARKGILVVTSMGNDGLGFWQVLCTPADADSVLSVGGINPETGYHINFSSYGPTADMRMKPNVCAFGKVIAADKHKLKTMEGTSFSTPLVAGFAACVLQMNPGWNNMQVLNEIEKSASLYPYFDYAHGFGIPQASYFTGSKTVADTTFDVLADDISIRAKIRPASMPDSTEKANDFYFYYNITKPTGVIRKYFVVEVNDQIVVTVPKDELRENEYLRFHYKGFTKDFYPNK